MFVPCRNKFGAANGLRFHAEPAGVNASELRAKEDYLRRIINPDEHDDQRTHRAINGRNTASADVGSDQKLSDVEKHRRDESAEPDIAPRNFHIRQEFENYRE
jgi:hypothetical protein